MSKNRIEFSVGPISSHVRKMEKILTINTTTFEICHPKIEWEWSWTKLRNVKYVLHLTKDEKMKIRPLSSSGTIGIETEELKRLRERIEEIKSLMENLSKDVVTRGDLKRTETLLIQNQERLQTMLKENMTDLKKTLDKEIKNEIGTRKAKRFWRLLEKVATVSDLVDFAKHVKDLLVFLSEQKTIQIALPFILKMILG